MPVVVRPPTTCARVVRRIPAVAAADFPVHTKPKDTGEAVDYTFDFSGFPEFAAGETLASASVPAVSGLTIGSPAVIAAITDGVPIGKGVQVRISGGTANTEYTVVCRGTFSGGSIRTIRLKLEVN